MSPNTHRMRPARLDLLIKYSGLVMSALLTMTGATCATPGGDMGGQETGLNVPAGETVTVNNNEEQTLKGDSVIDGTLQTTGRLVLRVEGNLTVNGALIALDPAHPSPCRAPPSISSQPASTSSSVQAA